MRIIGHRGAAGLALENTMQSLKKAKQVGVDGVEIDIRLTLDRRFVLCHDKDISRVSDADLVIGENTLEELKKIKLRNGEALITLEEALTELQNLWTIIEAKDGNCAQELIAVLDKFPDNRVSVASFNHELASELEQIRPELSVYLAEHTKPTEILRLIRTAEADGMDLNAWLLNPLTYWLAKRQNFDIIVYTINSPFVARFIKYLYPDVGIVTDYPDRLIKHSGTKKPQIDH